MFAFLRRMFGSHDFILEIKEGRVVAAKGKVLNRMLSEFTDCARQHGITRGTIYGEKGPGVIRLAFSKEIPEPLHQQFRNIWAQYN